MKTLAPLLGLALWCHTTGNAAAPAPEFRRLAVSQYRDKMTAGWLGQIAGVCLGAPTEFRFKDRIIPDAEMPPWKPAMINDAFGQDDLYVEMTFLRTLEQHGLKAPIRQAGIDFANSKYPLWCANHAGRSNLRAGIAPPDSGHPHFNKCPNDIDYQIEADYSGLISPGLPNMAVALGEKFGRLMNYGDGLYAGQFVGAMYAAAFFESEPANIIEQALLAIPAQSQYAEMVRDMLAWYRADPDQWEQTWQKLQAKYRQNLEYQKASNGGIDCKINGAYVLMGLLYGRKDPDQTMIIACRCGMDSDCNPSSAAGVLFTALGLGQLPERFASELDRNRVFSHTAYTFPKLIAVCEQLARQVIRQNGGRIVKESGQEVFLLPVQTAKPSPLELSWAPGPIANSRFTRAEMAQIKVPSREAELARAVATVAPGWQIRSCGPDMDPGLRAQFCGKTNVLATHPLNPNTGCVLSRIAKIPAGKKTVLRVVVGHDPQGDFDLIVRANGQVLVQTPVSKDTARDHWLTLEQDLSPFAGKTVLLELVNQPSGWAYEAAYWAEIAITSH